MWELIKNDPILKTIFVLLLGIFAFGFAFNIMFGSPQVGMEHGMNQMSGYSLNNTLAYTVSLLTKILIILLIIAAIITAIKFIKNHVINDSQIKIGSQTEILNKLKSNPLYSIIAVLGLLLLFVVVISALTPNSIGNNYYSFSLISLLITLMRIVLVISFIGLITGGVLYFKETYNIKISVNTLNKKQVCKNCNTELKSDWKICPICGTEVKENKSTMAASVSNSDSVDQRG